jgi:hypothetical protein
MSTGDFEKVTKVTRGNRPCYLFSEPSQRANPLLLLLFFIEEEEEEGKSNKVTQKK